MPADPQHPGSPGGVSRPGRWADWDRQEEVLAEEVAAFPAEDEPGWEALEDAEHSGDEPGEYSGDEPWSVRPPGAHPGAGPGDHLADTAAAGDRPAAPSADVSPTPGVSPVPGAPPVTGGSRVGAWFAHGGVADVMPPGPQLAALADQAWDGGLDGLDDDELAGVLAAQARLAARAAAGQLAVISKIVALREAEARASGDWRALEHAQDEIALTLTLTRPAAAWRLDLALALNRLPLTRAALATGAIDERRAAVIADEISGLNDEHAAAVEALIIGKAAGQTTGQLRPAVRRAVIAADPLAAKRRKDEALKDARVETGTSPSGTATLAGRDLPPAEVLAADKYLTALAKAMKKAGALGTMDQLRARAYLHLLAGGTPTTLLTPPTASTTSGGTPGGGTPGDGTPGDGTPGGSGEASGRPGNGTLSDGTPGDSTPGDSTPGDGTPATGTPGNGAPGGAADGTGSSTADGGAAGSETEAPGPALPALRGTVNLTMPLAAWLGWTQSPGQVPGFGTLDAEDSRALAAMLARDPATKWCLTLTNPAGHAIAHGCAPHGPPPHPSTDSHGPGPPADSRWIRAVKITPLQTGECTHPRETRSYQPTQALRHIIEIRQATCSRPGCRRAATSCDLDHTIPYHLGGRTCECDLGPVCRHDHHTKQAPGWTLTQTQPGHMTWTTPSRRTYTTGPTSYPD